MNVDEMRALSVEFAKICSKACARIPDIPELQIASSQIIRCHKRSCIFNENFERLVAHTRGHQAPKSLVL